MIIKVKILIVSQNNFAYLLLVLFHLFIEILIWQAVQTY